MKSFEFKREHLSVDREMEVDDDCNRQINFYLDCWFNVDEKFGININDEDGTWLNLYGFYNPFEDTLQLKGQISYDDGSSDWFDYEPTAAESKLIKNLLTAEIEKEWHQTTQEFCEQYMDEPEITPTQGGPT